MLCPINILSLCILGCIQKEEKPDQHLSELPFLARKNLPIFILFVVLLETIFSLELVTWRRDTQHNDTQHNDAEQYDTQCNNTKHRNTRHNNTRHNST
jgi:hypothetical protein